MNQSSTTLLSAAFLGPLAIMVGCAGATGDDGVTVEPLDDGVGTSAVVGAVGAAGAAGAGQPSGAVDMPTDQGSSGTTGWSCYPGRQCTDSRCCMYKVTKCNELNRTTTVTYEGYCVSLGGRSFSSYGLGP